LGAVLYCLVTGRPPFQAATPLDTVLQVLAEEPAAVRQLQPGCPRDLETICHKCLQKEPARRYGSAAELAEDLRRFQAGEPIRARPVGRLEMAVKWVRRNPAVAALVAAVVLTLLGGAAVATYFAVQAHGRAGEALASARRAEQRRYVSDIRQAQRALDDADADQLQELLDGLQPGQTGGEDLRGFEWHYLWRLAHADLSSFTLAEGRVWDCRFGRDGCLLAGVLTNGRLSVRDLGTGREVFTLEAVTGMRYSPDGTRLVCGRLDGPLEVWDVGAGKRAWAFPAPPQLSDAVFSDDGTRLVTTRQDLGAPKTRTFFQLWDAATGQPLGQEWDSPGAPLARAALTAGGARLAMALSEFSNPVVKVCEAVTGKELFQVRGPERRLPPVAFSPGGAYLATAAQDPSVIQLCCGITGRPLRQFKGHTGPLSELAFQSDGRRLLSCGDDSTVRVWDVATGEELLAFPGRKRSRAIFSPGEDRLVGWSEKNLSVWDGGAAPFRAIPPARGRLTRNRLGLLDGKPPIPAHSGPAVLSPDGMLLALPWSGGYLTLFDTTTWQATALHRNVPNRGPFPEVAFTPDGRRLVCCSTNWAGLGSVYVLDTASGKEVASFQALPKSLSALTLSPDGQRLAVASGWNTPGGKRFRVTKKADGSVVKQASQEVPPSRGGEVCVRELGTGRVLFQRGGLDAPVARLAFSPDGQRLAAALGDLNDFTGLPRGEVLLWDLGSGGEPLRLSAHPGGVYDVGFSPDGKLLASAGGRRQVPGEVKLWDAATGQCLATFRGHQDAAVAVAFTPDGRRLASAGLILDRTVRLWDLGTGHEVLTLRGFSNESRQKTGLAFTADGLRLVVSGSEGARVYDARPPTEGRRTDSLALARVEALFDLPLPAADVVQRLRDDRGLGAAVRERALGLAGQFREERVWEEYAAASRAVAWQSGLDPGRYRLALRQAEVACRGVPSGYCLLALGMAQYRLGRYKEALVSLDRALGSVPDRLGPEPGKGGVPVALAFLAMTHHRLGNRQQARTYLRRLREGNWPDLDEVPALQHEASALLEGR
jgi:WD40 repeat protein